MSRADYHRAGADQIRADRQRVVDIEHELAARFERWSTLEDRARAAST
jgi:ABC transport system ATP-binding/permease protein